MAIPKAAPRVGVVGATGMVGRELVALLERRRFPVGELRPFSSGRARSSVRFKGRAIPAPAADHRALGACDLVFLVSSEDVARRFAPSLARSGVWVIDDSSEFRLDPKVPLVIPEVNAAALTIDQRLIAGPNCTMTGLAVAGWPLHKAARIRQARIASYQAVSGAGREALGEFFAQTRALSRLLDFAPDGRAPLFCAPRPRALPRAIAGNVFPQVGSFDAAGRSGEENKVAAELSKVWGAPGLRVSVTAVRVPVVRGHALAAWLGFSRPLSPARARRLLARAPGLELSDEGDYPTPLDTAGRAPVRAGRLRAGVDSKELALWVVSDNLLKGAALNSVQIAELLLRRAWLRRRA
ncbi:MAG: aspartate-semialdehyde dehydrogenase [Elusimicrobia bacterium]|nr:aspartate-semialdehyde dehydrogenase [Elusimicrobiota bacterium]